MEPLPDPSHPAATPPSDPSAFAPEPAPAYVPPPTPRLPEPPRLISGAWVALLGWLVPGLGQMVTGRVGAGVALLVVVAGLFTGGLALTDFTCVEPRTRKLEFAAHALIGGPTAIALHCTEGIQATRQPPWNEVGSLYAVVAGFLNLIAACAAAGEAARRNASARARHAEAVADVLEQARRTALAQRPVETPAPAADALPPWTGFTPPPVARPAIVLPEDMLPEGMLPSDALASGETGPAPSAPPGTAPGAADEAPPPAPPGGGAPA